MSIIKWFIDKFSCKSSCRFNIEEQVFDLNLHNLSLCDFDLKHKDILKIHKILQRRDIKPQNPKTNISNI